MKSLIVKDIRSFAANADLLLADGKQRGVFANAMNLVELKINSKAGRKYDVMLIWQEDFVDFLAFWLIDGR